MFKDTHNKTIISSKNKPTLTSGNYIWIIGGMLDGSTVKSSIWSIAKHKWITGPPLPSEIKGLIKAI